MKFYAYILTVAVLAFALGWFMRGDMIYGKMYEHAYNSPSMADLADKLGGKK